MKKISYLVIFLFFTAVSFAEEECKHEISVSSGWKTTSHKITVGGESLSYDAIVGTLPIKDEKGEVFFTFYRKKGKENRPISFCFNGGPGASSAYLHFGGLGPFRIDSDQQVIDPPYRFVENQESWLTFTDLVFVDPVGTGFSPYPEEEGKELLSVKGDFQGLTHFITQFLSLVERWNSAKYLIGESYGSFRIAGLAEKLQIEHGVYLNGLVMIGTILDYQAVLFDRFAIISPIAYLPSYAATSWYHNKLPAKSKTTLEWAVKQAKQFAYNDYALALLRGDTLSDVEIEKLQRRLCELTGLSFEVMQKHGIRIDPMVYTREILGERQKAISFYDSRLAGFAVDYHGWGTWPDPGDVYSSGKLAVIANSYLRTILEYEGDFNPYELLSIKVNESWDYQMGQLRNLDVGDALRYCFAQNPDMRIYSANGYYDLATPYTGAEYAFEHLDLPKKFQKSITTKTYEGGHMLYLDDKVRKSLKCDIERFYTSD